MEEAVQVLTSGLSQGGVYALVGLGFSITFMASRILNLAQGSYAVVGGFIFLTMVTSYRLPMPVAFLAAVLVSGLLGVGTERIVNMRTKPWRAASLDMAVLATLALLVLFEGAAFLIWGSDPQRGPSLQPGVIRVFGALVSWQSIWMMVTVAVVATTLQLFLKRTWMGWAMRACAQNPMMSYLLGINVRLVGALAFALGAMIGAVAGILASPITWLDYQLGGFFMLNGILAYLIGGEEEVAGPLIGGLSLGIVQNVFLLIPGSTGGLLKQVVPMLILIILLVFRPQGLLPRRA